MSDQISISALLEQPEMTADQAAVDAILNAAAQSASEANVASASASFLKDMESQDLSTFFPHSAFVPEPSTNGSSAALPVEDAQVAEGLVAAEPAAEDAAAAAAAEEVAAPELVEEQSETSNLKRRTSSRALASARTYKEIDENDDSIDIPSSPASSEASGVSSNRSKPAKRPRKKSTGGAPAVGIPLSFTAARELSLLARLKLTRQANRGPAWRNTLVLFPEDYLKSLTTPESRDFLKVFDLKTNTLVIRPPPTAARLNKALTILHTAAATPEVSDLYKSWVAAKYDGENLLLAGALREQIMRYLTRHKNRPDPVEKDHSSSKAAKDDEEDELNDFEEEGDDEDEAGPSHKRARITEPKESEEDAVGELEDEEDAVGEVEEEDAAGEPDVSAAAVEEASAAAAVVEEASPAAVVKDAASAAPVVEEAAAPVGTEELDAADIEMKL